MRKMLLGMVGAAAMAIASSASAQSVVIAPGAVAPISMQNDFRAQLLGLGLTNITTTGAGLNLTADAVLTFELLGSESGFNDTFTAGAVSFTEMSSFTPWGTMLLGSSSFTAGSLTGDLLFSSAGGVNATVGNDGFGIFWGPNTAFAGTNVFYIGYDDQITTAADDNHDDMIIRVTVSPAVPEPGTWAMMLLGFGAVGFAIRRRRAPALAQLA